MQDLDAVLEHIAAARRQWALRSPRPEPLDPGYRSMLPFTAKGSDPPALHKSPINVCCSLCALMSRCALAQ